MLLPFPAPKGQTLLALEREEVPIPAPYGSRVLELLLFHEGASDRKRFLFFFPRWEVSPFFPRWPAKRALLLLFHFRCRIEEVSVNDRGRPVFFAASRRSRPFFFFSPFPSSDGETTVRPFPSPRRSMSPSPLFSRQTPPPPPLFSHIF